MKGQSKTTANRIGSILGLSHSQNETPRVSGNGKDRPSMCIDYVKHIPANDAILFSHCFLNSFSSSIFL